ncbi:hypothetical protein LAUMK142_03548 [Mycobacterium pseudokansasii]|uniref:Uncharacterized protein n=1 Tax=Mycobacterium pseudokansasii TaxID=2341080 RepID=A0A498QX99_9MYCO|nr:hypothetical protein LAUMK142_03548 [Mycobacterium pseudokansasii]
MLHGVELVMLLQAAGMVGRLVRAQPGHGAGLAMVPVLMAVLMVGWQAVPLLRGQRSLNPAGLAVQSGIVMTSIAVATRNLVPGLIGIALACAVLAGWGRLANSRRVGIGRYAGAAPPQATATAAPQRASDAGLGGVVLAVVTALVVLAALSVRSGIIFGLAILAIIFIPLERLFALHPRRVLRRGWRTDVVHYLVNGTALRLGLLVSVVVIGGVLRVFVPGPVRYSVSASPGWVQLVAGVGDRDGWWLRRAPGGA